MKSHSLTQIFPMGKKEYMPKFPLCFGNKYVKIFLHLEPGRQRLDKKSVYKKNMKTSKYRSQNTTRRTDVAWMGYRKENKAARKQL